MLTRTFNYIFKHLLTMLCLLAVVSCTDELAVEQSGTENPLNQDKGIGELVLFSSGNSGNSSTRAVIPYMELDGRFVCKMYYHAKATDQDSDPFDTETTPITSWLRVNDNEGNSVYWNNQYTMDADETHSDYIDYGFDSRAQYFYWRNRLDHIFLAYTDFNLLKRNKYELTNKKNEEGKYIPAARSLFMYPEYDGAKKTKIKTEKIWVPYNYKKMVFGRTSTSNPDFDADKKAEYDEYFADPDKWVTEHPDETAPDPYTVPETIEVLEFKDFETTTIYPMTAEYAGHFPISGYYGGTDIPKATIEDTRNKVIVLIESSSLTNEQKTALKADLQRSSIYSEEENTAEGTFRNDRWWVAYKSDALADDGTLDFDKILVYQQREMQKLEDIIATAPANTFDLTRKEGMTSMADQPDPLIALTKMKPLGATQEANRVRLYFKHQFSQIQVNLTKGENTPDIKVDNILSVELLGVTKKGYVFTNINPDGSQIPPTYDPVVKKDFTPEQLKENEHGTSFSMFDMKDAKPQSSLKSFNAIAFGQLQAIRITWKEDDYTEEDGTKVDGVKHVATYAITVDDRGHSLKNLESGYRYVYDFELRRGTIAFIRAIIDGWQLDDELDHKTDGFIDNSVQTN